MSKLERLIRNLGCTWCWMESKTKEQHKERLDPSQEIPIFFVMGPSSSGKTSVGSTLASSIGYTYTNTSALLEGELQRGGSNAKIIIEHMQTGSDVPPDIITGLLKVFIERTKEAKGFVISGFPSNIKQAQQFEFDIRKPNIIIYCWIPEEVYVERNVDKHGDIDKNVLTQKYSDEHKIYQGLYRLYEHKTLKLENVSPITENNEKLIGNLEHYWGFTFK